MIFHFAIVQVHMYFLLIEFHYALSISYKILPYYVYYYFDYDVMGCWDLFFPCSLYFFPSRPMRKCLENHSCMNSQFPLAILNGTLIFRSAK